MHQVKAPDALVGTPVQRSDSSPTNFNSRRFGTHFLGFLDAGHVKCCIHMHANTHINFFFFKGPLCLSIFLVFMVKVTALPSTSPIPAVAPLYWVTPQVDWRTCLIVTSPQDDLERNSNLRGSGFPSSTLNARLRFDIQVIVQSPCISKVFCFLFFFSFNRCSYMITLSVID